MIKVSQSIIDTQAAINALQKTAGDAGAIVSFEGIVRRQSHTDGVKALFLQAYEPMTTNGIKAAVTRANTELPLIGATVLHRTGTIAVGETIVFVAAASLHRRAAFNAVDMLMDYLKTSALFWKKEITTTGETWIEPRSQDYIDAQRWAQTATRTN